MKRLLLGIIASSYFGYANANMPAVLLINKSRTYTLDIEYKFAQNNPYRISSEYDATIPSRENSPQNNYVTVKPDNFGDYNIVKVTSIYAHNADGKTINIGYGDNDYGGECYGSNYNESHKIAFIFDDTGGAPLITCSVNYYN